MFLENNFNKKQEKKSHFKSSSKAAPLFKLTQGLQRPQCAPGRLTLPSMIPLGDFYEQFE